MVIHSVLHQGHAYAHNDSAIRLALHSLSVDDLADIKRAGYARNRYLSDLRINFHLHKLRSPGLERVFLALLARLQGALAFHRRLVFGREHLRVCAAGWELARTERLSTRPSLCRRRRVCVSIFCEMPSMPRRRSAYRNGRSPSA